ncbi:hypothetical protein IAU59_004113 [Kwoniella sp. CBS 9459]
MLTWPCDYPGCDKRSVHTMRTHGCTYCGKHLCLTHGVRPIHKCLTYTYDERQEARIALYHVETRARMDLVKASNIASVASSMRNNIPCAVEIPESFQDILEGGINALIPVVFEDGHRWLVRIKHQANRPPIDGYNRMVVESEAETIKVLTEHGLKVPAAYLPSKADTDPSQLSYFFVDFVDGGYMTAPFHEGDDSEEKVKKVIYQLAKFNIELSKLTFPTIGGLYPSTDGSSTSLIGPITSSVICEETPPYFPGPFRTNQERYLGEADFVLPKILEGVLFPDDPLPIYLWHLELKEIIRNYDNWQDGGPYYLKHGDDKGDHVMADAEGNITALIDWEWAFTTTKAEAFASPSACYSLDPLLDEGQTDLEPSELVLVEAYEELGRPDLAECVRNGRFYHLLVESMAQKPFIALINGMRLVLGLPRYEYDTTAEWVEEMKLKHGDDTGYQTLCKIKTST